MEDNTGSVHLSDYARKRSKSRSTLRLGSVGTHDMWIGGTKALARVGNQKEIAFLHFENEKKTKEKHKYLRLCLLIPHISTLVVKDSHLTRL